MEYLIILLVLPILPALICIYLARQIINWRALFFSVTIIFTLGVMGAYLGISRSIWNFTIGQGKTLGIQIFSIPIEDFLLAFFVPVWTIGLYEFIKKRTSRMF